MIINEFDKQYLENLKELDIQGYHFDSFRMFQLFKDNHFEDKSIISLFSVYDILGNVSLLKNKKTFLNFLKENHREEIIFAIPIFTPSFEDFYFQEWKDFVLSIIESFPSTKITFSIYTINQLEFLKEKVLKDIKLQPQINFNPFFYNQSLDPMFYILNMEDISIWNTTTFRYYSDEVKKYGFIPGKIETFLKNTKDYVSSYHYVNENKRDKDQKRENDTVEQKTLPFLFFAPKIIYSFSLRIFQFTKNQGIEISSLYDPLLLSKNYLEEKEIKDILYQKDFEELNADFNIGKVANTLLKHIEGKKNIELKCYYKNNYQYWHTEKEL